MSTITKSTDLFSPELVKEVFDATTGHSTLAKLSAQTPVPFSGAEYMTFTMDGEVSIVGEGGDKPAGEATVTPVTIKPIKVVYQHRLTDEFVNMAEEKQLPYLQAFVDGFGKKIARGLDIMAMHGLNPATKTAATELAGKSLDSVGSVVVTEGTEDESLESAIAAVQGADGTVNGLALAPAFASAMGKIKANGAKLYPEYAFGANPTTFNGMNSDVNNTVSFGDGKDLAIVGDFANAFKWGYSDVVNCEIIEYGDPDGLGDLKKTNQIVLRAEAYIGFGILNADSFKRIVKA